MGTAELGRELGDAGGPLIVGAIATAAALATGYGALALILAAIPTARLLLRRRSTLVTHIRTRSPSHEPAPAHSTRCHGLTVSGGRSRASCPGSGEGLDNSRNLPGQG